MSNSVLFGYQDIDYSVRSLAVRISGDYSLSAVSDVVALVILKGGLMLAADLLRHLTVNKIQTECLMVSSYKGGAKRPAFLREKDIQPLFDVRELMRNPRHILLIDDVFDTGQTLENVRQYLRMFQPASLKTAVLVKKSGSTLPGPDYFALEAKAESFLVGYGMDLDGYERNLPYIYDVGR